MESTAAETMLLVVDVGNSQTVVGLWDHGQTLTSARFRSSTQRTVDEWGFWLLRFLQYHHVHPRTIRAVAIASVVPPMVPTMVKMAVQYFGCEPFLVAPGIKTGISILYEDPKAVGPDRIANAVAAYRRYGGPCVVVDLGTATTFDVVSKDGAYLGGVIAPGIEISAEALFQRTARLPRVDISRPPGIIGRNTSQSMQSGIFYGYLGLIERIAQEIEKELPQPVHFIATGGLAPLFHDASPYMQHLEPHLTLEGIALLYQLNRPDSLDS